MNIFRIFFLSFFIIFSSNIFAQSHEEHEFKHFKVALNLGHVFIPTASTEENKFVIIPVFGLDFQYWFNHKWGLGLKNDLEISTYYVENKEDDSAILERKNPVIISLPVYFKPWETNGLTFFMGPGIELEDHENFSVLRFGLGYEIEIPGHWEFSPEVVYDLKNGHINSFTLALGIGKKF